MKNSLHLLRYVDNDSVVHHLNPRAKILALVTILLVMSFDASWRAVAVIWTIAVGGALVARLPRSVTPRPPRLLLGAIVITCLLGLLAGGEPYGLGGLILQVRLFAFTIGLLALSLVLGWTTPTADLPVAAAWLLRPLRRLGLNVDDVVAGLALAVRALPLVADEFSTVVTLSRFRKRTFASPIVAGMDLAATATTATVRRGIEMGEAVEARGGSPTARQIEQSPSVPNRWGRPEAVLALVVAAAVATVIV